MANRGGQPIPLKSFAPDMDPLTPGVILACQNAVPTMKGFRAMPSPVALSQALPAIPLGAAFALYSNDGVAIVAGTAQHLYRLNFGTAAWDEIDGGQTFAATSRWRFIQFGDDLIALSEGVAPQVALGYLGTFGPLGGLPVHAGLGVSVGGFVVLFDGIFWYSSAAGADDNWNPDIQTLAATGALYDYPGKVKAVGQLFRDMIVFKQAAMWRGSFAGAPSTWAFDVISDQIGTWGQECVIPMADSLAFIGNDDFYVTGGTAPQRIPNSPKEWFFRLADQTRLYQSYGWFDLANSVIYWHFATRAAPVGQLDHYIAYSLRGQRWAEGTKTVICVPYPNNSFQNGLVVDNAPTYFDTTNILQRLQGTPGLMQLTTHYMGDPNVLNQLQRVRFHYGGDGLEPTISQCIPFHTPQIGRTPTQAPPGVLGPDGWFNFRQVDRYHRLIISTQGNAEITALTWMFRPAGSR